MTMEKGAVQQVLYQLYTALNRKKKRNLTGTAMETMTAPAAKILAQAETQQYQNVSELRGFSLSTVSLGS